MALYGDGTASGMGTVSILITLSLKVDKNARVIVIAAVLGNRKFIWIRIVAIYIYIYTY